MPFPIRSITKIFPKHCVVENVFDKAEIEKIIDIESLLNFKQACIGHNKEKPILNQEKRNSNISWITPSPESGWVFDRLADLIPKVNYDMFMYSLSHIEDLQYTVYDVDQHYDWHIDSWHDQILQFNRKISFSIMLSDPNDYEGGELEIVPFGMFNNKFLCKPNIGSIVFFDSLFPHKVNPVAKGIRKSLVSWVMGANDVKFY